jgi:hypothetical protein
MNKNSTVHLYPALYKEKKMRKKIAILFIASLMLVATGIPAFAEVSENTDTQGVVSKAVPSMEISRNGNPICHCFCEGNNDLTQTTGVMLEPRNIHYPCWCECGYEPPIETD